MRLPTVREEREAFVTAPVDVAAAAPPQPSDERPRSSEPDPPEGSAVDLVRRLLFAVWSDWRLRIGIALAVSMVFGLVVGVWTPRGPLNSGQALASIGASLLVGAIAGVSMRSRWSMLLAPVVFAAVFELTRRSTNGTTVDAIHPGSTYGVLALVVGRGVHGIVSLAPIQLMPTFTYACAYNPTFLNLYAKHLMGLGCVLPYLPEDGAYRRYTGDTSVPGKGEIFVWSPHPA